MTIWGPTYDMQVPAMGFQAMLSTGKMPRPFYKCNDCWLNAEDK